MRLYPLVIVAVSLIAQTGNAERLIGRPDLAVKLAAKDCQENPEEAHNFWYIWIRDNQDKELIDCYDYCLNIALSRADYPLKTVKIDGGTAGTLLRVDRSKWLPELKHQFNFERIIQGYYDPYFYLDFDEFIKKSFDCPPFTLKGQSYKGVRLHINKVDFSPPVLALAEQEARFLQEATNLTVPIVEAEKWLVQSLRTLQDGLYYKLQGFDKLNGVKKKRLNQEEWLSLWGASEKESRRLNGEEFIGMWRSQVTGKPRRAKFIYGTGVRPSVGPPLIVITQDGTDEALETDQHPIYSLFDFEFDATEILATKPNGAIAYGLFAGDGTLQDSAPDNVVKDHEIPEPHTGRLEPAISCIRCHAPESQWKAMPNQVKELLSSDLGGQRLEVLADQTKKEVFHNLRAKYSGDLTLPIKLARDSQEFATIKMVDFRLEGDGYAVEAATRISERFNKYLYPLVTPQEVLRCLGLVVEKENAVEKLKEILPLKGQIDPAVASLHLGLGINRTDLERIYPALLGTAITYGRTPNENP